MIAAGTIRRGKRGEPNALVVTFKNCPVGQFTGEQVADIELLSQGYPRKYRFGWVDAGQKHSVEAHSLLLARSGRCVLRNPVEPEKAAA